MPTKQLKPKNLCAVRVEKEHRIESGQSNLEGPVAGSYNHKITIHQLFHLLDSTSTTFLRTQEAWEGNHCGPLINVPTS